VTGRSQNSLIILFDFSHSSDQWLLGLKVGGAEDCSFSTDNCKFPTAEIVGIQSFNFASKFS